jgi:hypothetical protein
MSLICVEHEGKVININPGQEIPIPKELSIPTCKSLFLGQAAIEDLAYWKSIGSIFYPIKLVSHSGILMPDGCQAMAIYLPNLDEHHDRGHTIEGVSNTFGSISNTFKSLNNTLKNNHIPIDTNPKRVPKDVHKGRSKNSNKDANKHTKHSPKSSCIPNIIQETPLPTINLPASNRTLTKDLTNKNPTRDLIKDLIDISPLFITEFVKPITKLVGAFVGSSLLNLSIPNSTRLLTGPSYDEDTNTYTEERTLLLYDSTMIPNEIPLMYDFIVCMWLTA